MPVHTPIAHVPNAMREAVIPDVPIRMVSMGLTLPEFVLSANPNVMTKCLRRVSGSDKLFVGHIDHHASHQDRPQLPVQTQTPLDKARP
jgi:hypothetical protein